MTLFARFLVLQVVNIHRFPRRVGVRHQRTSRNITKHCEIMKESESSEISYDIMIYLETSWDIMTLISIFPVFFDCSGMSPQSTYIWRWADTRGKWGSDISWYVMKHHETSWTLFQYISVVPDFFNGAGMSLQSTCPLQATKVLEAAKEQCGELGTQGMSGNSIY